jgi:hypothetical protein
MPKPCPPPNAGPANGVIFRGIPKPPISEDDFLSHPELNRPNCDHGNCEHWGLSVWVSKAEAEHAQRIFRYMRKWHIASGSVNGSDGVIMQTPSNQQPNHHTFWKIYGLEISSRFQIVIQPLV